MEIEVPDGTFTEEEIKEIIDWLESITIVDIAALKKIWESMPETQDMQ
jgi:hypothetical protein